MTKEEIAALTPEDINKLAESAKADIDAKDAEVTALKSNCDLLEKQLAELVSEHQETLERLTESAATQKELADLLKTSEPRLEAMKRANRLLTNQVARLTRLHAAAAERARGVKNVLNG